MNPYSRVHIAEHPTRSARKRELFSTACCGVVYFIERVHAKLKLNAQDIANVDVSLVKSDSESCVQDNFRG